MKNKLYNFFIKTIYLIIIILVISFFTIYISYYWLSNKWRDFYTEKELKLITNKINKSNKLPNNFYIAYDKLYPNQRTKNINSMSLQIIYYILTNNHIYINNQKQCNCILISKYFDNKSINYNSWTYYIIAHGLESYTTEEKCFDYLYQNIDLEKKSLKYLKKKLGALTVSENTILIKIIEE